MTLETQLPEEIAEATVADEDNLSEKNDVTPEAEKEYTDTLRTNNRAHLTSSVPKAAKSPHNAMTKQELSQARELFDGMDDAEIQRLYRRVND